MVPPAGSERLWHAHDVAWRDPGQIVSQWREGANVDPRLLRMRATGDFWSTLSALDLTLLVSREYEHLLLALGVEDGRPIVTHMVLPHPSGIAFDQRRGVVHVASTRNPNQIYHLRPVAAALERADSDPPDLDRRPLVPVGSDFLPGSLYLHDLALIGGKLHGNAVGHNAVVRLDPAGRWQRRWWPRCIEDDGVPDFGLNYLQLNSIAAGRTLAGSFFSASGDHRSSRRPGHRNYPVDGRGVVFSGRTREPVAGGLTRPHSARFGPQGRLFVDDSGYGRLKALDGNRFETVAALPGWTRGLAIHSGIAFVGTSRVIPRFRSYAPGLEVDSSVCGIHAIDLGDGSVLGSLIWPHGNQIFAVEALPSAFSLGFPFALGRGRSAARLKALFYSFDLASEPLT